MKKYQRNQDINKILLSLNLLDNKDESSYIKNLYAISNNIENNYHIYKIKKHSGGTRTIYEPNKTLKHIQRQILNNILNEIPISKYAKAYHKNISLKDNATPHINQKIILKLDIKNFFDNINFTDVYTRCFKNYPKPVGMLLTYLCTYYDYLPQGAPTSAYISNLVMKKFDNEIGEWCNLNKINYTRYSDDMTFSGDFTPSIIIKKVRTMLRLQGLNLNNKKIHVINNYYRQSITGVVVNKKTQVSINYRKQIRQEIYYLKKYGLTSHLNHTNNKIDPVTYLNKLYGKILFVLQINPQDKEFLSYKNYLLTHNKK